MNVNDEMVYRIAALARLSVNSNNIEKIKADLNKMINFVEKLKELDTENVEPLKYMCSETNLMRDDVVKTDITKKEAIDNAPDKFSDYFKVPKVLNK